MKRLKLRTDFRQLKRLTLRTDFRQLKRLTLRTASRQKYTPAAVGCSPSNAVFAELLHAACLGLKRSDP
ncbi:hypothetical protein ACLBWT_09750 [Paenibacillus sp. D51F]